MVAWSNSWGERLDANKVLLKLWCEKRKDDDKAWCKLCNKMVVFKTQGVHALIQHSRKECHKKISDLRFSNTNRRFAVKSHSTSTNSNNSETSTSSASAVEYELSSQDQISSAEALWSFKVASADYSLRSCDDMPLVWRGMFPDSPIAAGLSYSRTKASYIFADGLGPLLAKRICEDLKNGESGFTILFDETGTVQGKKQLDFLLRFWSEEKNEVVTRYLTSFMFGRTSHEHIVEMIMSLKENFDLPWERFFNLSSDGPNINIATWNLLNEVLKKSGHKGLLALITCTLHIVHNAFQKGINEYGQDCEQLSFDFHTWFKISPCKQEDFRNLSDDLNIEQEALFLRHVDSRWLTLAPALERVLKRWEDAKEYFLNYIPSKKEYKKTLSNNKRYQRIQSALKSENRMLIQIKFLVGVAPLLTKYLKVFQAEGPLVHVLFIEMKSLLVTLMKRFLKADVVDGKKATELQTLVVTDESNQLPLKEMDIGAEVSNQLKKLRKEDVIAQQKLMQKCYIKMTQYLQKKLPINSSLLQDLRCLHPLLKDKTWTVNCVGRLAETMPHVIDAVQVSQIKDEWKALQAEDIPQEWAEGRVDHYYAKIFDIKNSLGATKYNILPKLVKSALSLQNGNAAVERSLSDNKNTLTHKRSNLSAPTLIGLRRANEHSKKEGGAHQVAINKEMLQSLKCSHQKYQQRLKVEEEEKNQNERQKMLRKETLEKQKLELDNLEKSKGKLQRKEDELKKDELETENMQSVAEKMLKEGNEKLALAISNKDFSSVEIAYALIDSAKKKLDLVSTHRLEQKVIHEEIGVKRKSLVSALMSKKKKNIEQ